MNRVPGGCIPEAISAAVKATGLTLLAAIPLDQDVAALDADGVPVSTISPGSPARLAMNALLAKLFADQQEKN